MRDFVPEHSRQHASHFLPGGMVYFDEKEAVWRAMQAGWAAQQMARNLSSATVVGRTSILNRFFKFAEKYPWQWNVEDVDSFFLELRTVRHAAHSTVLGYQNALRMFLAYVTDARYGWVEECGKRFGEHPAQVFHEWNTARHVQEAMGRPGKRPYTRDELQDLFDCADDRVARIRESGSKGWIPAFRIATMMKVAYAWGLRRNEVRSLEVVDLAANPQHRRAFRNVGFVYVRFGKAMRGSPPKRRAVATLPQFKWAVDCVEEWLEDVRPLIAGAGSMSLWPSERGGGLAPITADSVSRMFTAVRREVGLDDGLDFHSLRRSYVTHLVELGYDAFFIQQQVGHEHGSTTSIYTGLSPDYRARIVTDAIARMADEMDSEAD